MRLFAGDSVLLAGSSILQVTAVSYLELQKVYHVWQIGEQMVNEIL